MPSLATVAERRRRRGGMRIFEQWARLRGACRLNLPVGHFDRPFTNARSRFRIPIRINHLEPFDLSNDRSCHPAGKIAHAWPHCRPVLPDYAYAARWVAAGVRALSCARIVSDAFGWRAGF